jgi:hypothetical protein
MPLPLPVRPGRAPERARGRVRQPRAEAAGRLAGPVGGRRLGPRSPRCGPAAASESGRGGDDGRRRAQAGSRSAFRGGVGYDGSHGDRRGTRNRSQILRAGADNEVPQCDTGFTMLNPVYQNPDRRGRAGVTRGDRDDRGWKGFIKHTDIHLRIRTLIRVAEAGRELRAATVTETIEDGKVADPTVSVLFKRVPGVPPYVGVTRSYECSRHKQSCVYVALFDNQLSGSPGVPREYTESPIPHGCTSCAE